MLQVWSIIGAVAALFTIAVVLTRIFLPGYLVGRRPPPPPPQPPERRRSSAAKEAAEDSTDAVDEAPPRTLGPREAAVRRGEAAARALTRSSLFPGIPDFPNMFAGLDRAMSDLAHGVHHTERHRWTEVRTTWTGGAGAGEHTERADAAVASLRQGGHLVAMAPGERRVFHVDGFEIVVRASTSATTPYSVELSVSLLPPPRPLGGSVAAPADAAPPRPAGKLHLVPTPPPEPERRTWHDRLDDVDEALCPTKSDPTKT
jgi:hypothetical protein